MLFAGLQALSFVVFLGCMWVLLSLGHAVSAGPANEYQQPGNAVSEKQQKSKMLVF